jgi:hypothetical protein
MQRTFRDLDFTFNPYPSWNFSYIKENFYLYTVEDAASFNNQINYYNAKSTFVSSRYKLPL